MYTSDYRRKLTTPEKAVEYLKHSQTLIHGVANGEPPALLAAIAQRIRNGDLADIKVYTPSLWSMPPTPSSLLTWPTELR